MPDIFASTETGLDSPAQRHFTITPSATELPQWTRGIYASTSGTATIEDAGGVSIEYIIAAGTVLPIRARRVTAATATLIGWY